MVENDSELELFADDRFLDDTAHIKSRGLSGNYLQQSDDLVLHDRLKFTFYHFLVILMIILHLSVLIINFTVASKKWLSHIKRLL